MTITATDTVLERLRERAEEVSHPFCYGDYIKIEANEDGDYRCPKCGSDDLMREVDGIGCEYGTDWIMEHLVRTEGEEVDIDELCIRTVTTVMESSVSGSCRRVCRHRS